MTLDDLKNFLDVLDVCRYVSGNTEITIRCPFCGDSDKKNHSHFYIGEKDDTFLYHCKRCNTKGVLTTYLFDVLGIKDINAKSELIKHNKNFERISAKSLTKHNTYKLLNYNFINSDIKINPEKLDYIKTRLNRNKIPKELITKYKIIISIKDFLKKVNITNDSKIIEMLENDYVGFLTNKNTKVIFRNIYQNKNMRFYSFNLLENNAISDFYTIKNTISNNDLVSKDMEIILTEGIFSLLNVYEKIYKSNNDKKIYIAVLNKDYISKILDMIKISGNPNLNISIYSDSEVKEEFILFQLRNLKLVNNVSIYKNMGQPDFGFFPINPYLVKSVNY